MYGTIDDPTNPPSKEQLQAFLNKHGISAATFTSVAENIEDRHRALYIRKTNLLTLAQWQAIVAFCKHHGFPGADTYGR